MIRVLVADDHAVVRRGLVHILDEAPDMGAGVSISNVTFTGANVAGGTFNGGTGIIGFEDGVVLSSGNVANVIGPNTSDSTTGSNGLPGDPDLDTLSAFATRDAAVLEFDFVPEGDKVSFRYVFGSEEYNEFVYSFNDVFGFFINGVNCALLPDGSPVAINTVNGGNPYGTNPSNPAYYRNNDLSDGGGTINTELDGLTVVLTCQADVTPNVTNHAKLGVADAVDTAYDSDVFIQAGSFSSNFIVVDGLDTDDWGSICPTLTDHPGGEYDPDEPLNPNHTIEYVCAAFSDSYAYFRVDTTAAPEQSEAHIFVDNGPQNCAEGVGHGSSVRYDLHIQATWGGSSWQTQVQHCTSGSWGGFTAAGNAESIDIWEIRIPRADFGGADDVAFFVKYGTDSDFAPDAGSDPPTLIDLVSLSATAGEGGVLVEWSTASEIDNAGFNVYRQAAGGEFIRLNTALIPAQGGSTQGAAYSFLDVGSDGGYYKLEDVDVYGVSTFHGPVYVSTPTAVGVVSLATSTPMMLLVIPLLGLTAGGLALLQRKRRL